MFNFRKSNKDSFFDPPPSVPEAELQITDTLGDGVFLRNCGSLGIVYELSSGVYDEPLTITEMSFEYDRMTRFLRETIKGLENEGDTVTQFICSQRQADPVTSFKAATEAGKILEFENNYVEQMGLIKRRFIIAVLWEPKKKSSLTEVFKKSIKGDEQSYATEILLKKEKFLKYLARIESASELGLTKWSDSNYIDYISECLCKGEKPKFESHAQPFHQLSHSITANMAAADKNGFKFGNGQTGSYFFPNLPEYFALGRFKAFVSSIPATNWDMAWCMSEGHTKLSSEHFARLLWFARGPAYKKHHQDVLNLQDKTSAINPYGKLSVGLNVYDDNDEVEAKMRQLATVYLQCSIRREDSFGVQIFCRSLPLNSSSAENGIACRFTTKSLDTAKGFLPFFDGPQGKGIRVWQSTRKFPAFFNLFQGESNRTTVLLGKSGAGKSVMNGSIILEFMERNPNGVVRVIDNKSSYSKLADLLGGKVVKFSKEEFKKSPYSPFAIKHWSEDDIELVRSFICSAIAFTNQNAVIESIHTDIIEESLRRCANAQEKDFEYEKETGGEVYPHFIWPQVVEQFEVAAEAKKQKDLKPVEDILRWTTSFGETGSLGFIFCTHESKEQLSDDIRFLVYDLENLNDPKLQNIASQLVALKTTRDIQKFSQSIPKLVIFEELGVYLHGETPAAREIANRFVMNVTKTVRKMNGIPFGISNATEDFFASPGGRSFWKQATQKIFLPFTADMFSDLQDRANSDSGERVALNEADLDIIKNLEIVDGHYSQAYLLSENSNTKVVINMPLSPAMYALLNTTPSQINMYNYYRNSGLSAADAIDKLTKDRIETLKE